MPNHFPGRFPDYISAFTSVLFTKPRTTRKKPGIPRLPPELSYHIVGFLHSDPDALRACSLVCKDWSSASRLYHPRTLSIDQDNVRALAGLLSHPLSTFSKSYSMVEIRLDPSVSRRRNLEDRNVLDILAVHLDKIKTQSLVLSGAQWQPVRKEHEDALSNWLARITELQLIGDLHHPDSFYTCCPLLERLTFVMNSGLCSGIPIGDTPMMYPPRLHTIRLSFEGTAILPPWLGLSRGCRPIDRLELYAWYMPYDVVGSVMDRLEVPAHTLYIVLRMEPNSVFANAGRYWHDLNHCLNARFTELRRVQIHILLQPCDLSPDLVLSHIRGSMPDLEGRKILELSLSFVAFNLNNWNVRLLDPIPRSADF